MENNQTLICRLNHLIAVAEDRRLRYEDAANDVADEIMKKLFSHLAHKRATYARQLSNCVLELGGEVELTEPKSGMLTRFWNDLKDTIVARDAAAIVNNCIRGEQTAIKEYSCALEKNYIIGNLRKLLTEQCHGLESALISINSNCYRNETLQAV